MELSRMKLITENGMWCVYFEGEIGLKLKHRLGTDVVPMPFSQEVPEKEVQAHLDLLKADAMRFDWFPDGNSE